MCRLRLASPVLDQAVVRSRKILVRSKNRCWSRDVGAQWPRAFLRPAAAGDPDGENEKFFTPLEAEDSDLADQLVARYGRRWLDVGGLPEHRQSEVPDTVELVVAPDWTESPADRRRILRLRSWYTGSTYWLHDWDGGRESAEEWVDQVADLQGTNVESERRYGPTPWDDEKEWEPRPSRPRAEPLEFRGVIEGGDPGGSGFTITTEFAFSDTPTTDDVNQALERLGESPDVLPTLVAEARTRIAAGASPTEFFAWLATAATKMDKPSEPMDCDCGAALIDPTTWRGRAIVRCEECGSRWGVEVEDAETWSQWALDVPRAKDAEDAP